MIFREAQAADIKQIQVVRHAVKENRLSNPSLVTDEDCREYITSRGKGWVCEIENRVVGFAIADLKEHNIWALFVHPDYENLGIGKKLHGTMLAWYFANTTEKVWLSTARGTRAERFYRMQGWKDAGLQKNGEVKFEMEFAEWERLF